MAEPSRRRYNREKRSRRTETPRNATPRINGKVDRVQLIKKTNEIARLLAGSQPTGTTAVFLDLLKGKKAFKEFLDAAPTDEEKRQIVRHAWAGLSLLRNVENFNLFLKQAGRPELALSLDEAIEIVIL